MTAETTKITVHPDDAVLAAFLDKLIPAEDMDRVRRHLADCPECLAKVVSAYESVKDVDKKRKVLTMNNINIYLALAILSFLLSFTVPRYFLQFLVATLLLGAKWIVDSKTTRMLITIYEAWKSTGAKCATRASKNLNKHSKSRF
jgi:hypothetical protein